MVISQLVFDSVIANQISNQLIDINFGTSLIEMVYLVTNCVVIYVGTYGSSMLNKAGIFLFSELCMR